MSVLLNYTNKYFNRIRKAGYWNVAPEKFKQSLDSDLQLVSDPNMPDEVKGAIYEQYANIYSIYNMSNPEESNAPDWVIDKIGKIIEYTKPHDTTDYAFLEQAQDIYDRSAIISERVARYIGEDKEYYTGEELEGALESQQPEGYNYDIKGLMEIWPSFKDHLREISIFLSKFHTTSPVLNENEEYFVSPEQMEEMQVYMTGLMKEGQNLINEYNNYYGSAQSAELSAEQHIQANKKTASCYIDDVSIKDLKKSTVEDIKQFFPSCKPSHSLVRLNAVIDELVNKVDKKNWESAKKNIKGKHLKTEKLKKEVLDRKDKYILVLNDQIIDGHHYLAKAYLGGVTNSIKVLDITPLRFQ